MGTIVQDARYGARMLLKSPGFTAVALITLALGIGANTAIFTVVNAVLLRPLPFPESSRILRVQEIHGRFGTKPANLTGATFEDLREHAHSFSQTAAYRVFNLNLSDHRAGVAPEEITTAFITKDFLALLRVSPARGHPLSDDNFRIGGSRAVLLSHGLWMRHFGGDPNVIDSVVELHGKAYTVAGVMPPGMKFPDDTQAWTALTDADRVPQNRRSHLFTTLARLRDGVSLETARAETTAIAAGIERENPNIDPGLVFRIEPLQQNIVAGIRPALLMLLGAVALVMLIACSNVANLLLSRSVARHRDMAVRAALGASPLRLLRQCMTESMLLAVAGGALGYMVGLGGVRVLATAYPGAIPGLSLPGLDLRIFGFALAASVVAAFLFGTIPAWQFANPNLREQLVEIGRGGDTTERRRARSVLVVAEVAIAMVLLAGAGLLIRSFVGLQRVDPGYLSDHVAVAQLTLPGAQYATVQQRMQFVDAVLERLRRVPGVQIAAASGTLPLRPLPVTDLELEDRKYEPGNEPSAEILTVNADYFRAMGIRALAGRTFDREDTAGHPTAIVINQTTARQFWPNESAIGKRIIMKDWGPPFPGEVVGIVGDVKNASLDAAPVPAVYYSMAQFVQGTLQTYLVVRTEGAPLRLASSIREQVWAVNPNQPVNVFAMNDMIADSLQRRRFLLLLLATFAGLALSLAIIGIYGVVSYGVNQRTREFGIRMALGAHPRQVLAMVLRQSSRPLALGVALGLPASLALTRGLKGFLYGITTADPLTFVATTVLLTGAALVASYFPARRATRVDPLVALRYE